MNIALLYGSTRGSTERVAYSLKKDLAFPFDIYNVKDLPDAEPLKPYDTLLFLCPTYGDQEPQEDIENFFRRFNLDLTGKQFAICSIGTYEGYELFQPSCGRIVRDELLDRHATELMPMLCVDAFPGIDQRAIKKWANLLNKWNSEQCPTSAPLKKSAS